MFPGKASNTHSLAGYSAQRRSVCTRKIMRNLLEHVVNPFTMPFGRSWSCCCLVMICVFLMSSLPWLHQASDCIWLALPIWCCLVCRNYPSKNIPFWIHGIAQRVRVDSGKHSGVSVSLIQWEVSSIPIWKRLVKKKNVVPKKIDQWFPACRYDLGTFDHDLTVLPNPGIMVNKGNHPQPWPNNSG